MMCGICHHRSESGASTLDVQTPATIARNSDAEFVHMPPRAKSAIEYLPNQRLTLDLAGLPDLVEWESRASTQSAWLMWWSSRWNSLPHSRRRP